MKYLLSLSLFFVLLLMSCTNKTTPNSYTIEGHASNLQGGELILQKISDKKAQIIDTAKVSTDGKFIMKGPIDSVGIYQLSENPKNGVMMVLEPGTKLNIDLNFDELENYTISGNKGSEEIAEFVKLMNETAKSRQPIIEQYKNETDSLAKVQLVDKMKNLDLENKEKIVQQIQNFEDPTASLIAITLSRLNPSEYKETYNLVNDRLQKKIPNTNYSKDFKQKVDAINLTREKLKIGDLAYDIDLPNPEGVHYKLSDLRGKYVLLDFWAAWCGPCRRENPNVVKAYNDYKDKDFVVYNVSLDKDQQKWVKAIEKDELDWPYHVSDLNGWNNSAAKTYGIKSIPQNYLLDKEGKVIAINLRGHSLNKKLKELIQ